MAADLPGVAAQTGRFFLGKLAVADAHRGRGLALQLAAATERRAWDLGLAALELQTRPVAL